MSRRPARLLFVSSATAAASVILLAVLFALGPTTPPNPAAREIALVRLETLRPNTVVRLTVKELAGLDALANAERERAHMTMWGPRSRPAGMPVFVVRVGDGVHAFLGVDPRTGCDLDDKTAERGAASAVAFVDRCHGTPYDLTGRPTRGPGLHFLDQLVLQVRAGVVYAVPHRVTVGGVATPGY